MPLQEVYSKIGILAPSSPRTTRICRRLLAPVQQQRSTRIVREIAPFDSMIAGGKPQAFWRRP
jgi:hypothetical protein